MPWIKIIQEHESEGELKEAYDKMREVNLSYGETFGSAPPGTHPVTPPELSSLNPLSMTVRVRHQRPGNWANTPTSCS